MKQRGATVTQNTDEAPEIFRPMGGELEVFFLD
jgi:hypothetical protein